MLHCNASAPTCASRSSAPFSPPKLPTPRRGLPAAQLPAVKVPPLKLPGSTGAAGPSSSASALAQDENAGAANLLAAEAPAAAKEAREEPSVHGSVASFKAGAGSFKGADIERETSGEFQVSGWLAMGGVVATHEDGG